MKNIIYIITISLLLFSCADEGEVNVDEVIETNDLEKIKESRKLVHDKYGKLAADLEKLDQAIDSLDPNKKLPLVKTFTLKDTTFTHYIELQGNVDTKQNIVIYPEFSGVLEQLNAKAGQKVSKGQVLARIDDGGIGAQIAQAEAQLALATTTYERQKRLWDQKIGSEIQFLQTKTSMETQQKAVAQLRAQMAKTIVRAPISGTIDEVSVERGEVVAPGQRMMRVVSLSDMYITAIVPENYINRVEIGAPVEVYLNSLGKTYTGKVRQVGNFIDPNNRTFGIEVSVPNPDKLLRPNQVAVLKIEDYKTDNALLVPENIIQLRGDQRMVVYVLEKKKGKEDPIPMEREIETGYTSGTYIEVKSGLKEGDIIITDGAKAIDNDTEVEVIK